MTYKEWSRENVAPLPDSRLKDVLLNPDLEGFCDLYNQNLTDADVVLLGRYLTYNSKLTDLGYVSISFTSPFHFIPEEKRANPPSTGLSSEKPVLVVPPSR